MPSDSEKLWNSFRNGDKSAFEQIYRLNLSHLYEYGMRKVQDEAMVRDCIHDLFVRLWERRQKMNVVSNPRHYLLISLKNLLINAITRKDKLANFGGQEQFLLNFNLEKQIIKLEDDRLRAQKLADALDKLTPKQREVIYLRYFEELDYEEIAALMDISVKGLYKLHYRALDSLKEFLNMPKSDILLLFTLLRTLLF